MHVVQKCLHVKKVKHLIWQAKKHQKKPHIALISVNKEDSSRINVLSPGLT